MKKSIFLFLAAILCAVSMQAKVVYFKNTANWSSVHCHNWDGGTGTAWPGTAMKKIGNTQYYSLDIGNNKMCIFSNNGSNQTANLTAEDGKFYHYQDNYWSYFSLESYTIYFDIRNVTDWQNPHLRIGRGNYNSAYPLTLVAGTKYLYSVKAPSWENYEAYTIANSAGYTGENTIYQPSDKKPENEWAITKLINYQNGNILENKYITASQWEQNKDDADYWKVTVANTLPSYQVSYSKTGAGTLTVTKYTGSKYETLTSGSSVQPTQIIKIETNAECKLTVTGATQIDGGNTYYVTAATTIKAEFASVAKFAGELTDWANNAKSFTTNGNIATLDLELTQGKHKFKIIETAGDKIFWHGNTGTTSRTNCANWPFNQDADATINADVTGTYKLTWDFVTNKLTVTYPTFPVLSNQPDIIYFQPSERWTDGNARFAAYFMFGNVETDDKWENLTDTDGDGVYEVNNAKQHIAVIIVRMNPAFTENRWNTDAENNSENKPVWNQSADLYIPMDGNNWFKMIPKNDEEWDNSGEWLYYKKVNVTVSASPVEGGLVAGEGTYMYGEDVTLTATANPGYEFTGWSDGSTANPYIFTATEDVELVANFETATVEITEGNNSSVLTTNNGLNVNVEVQRQFKAGNLYTIALPFALNDVESVFGTGTIVYEYASLVQAGGEVVLNFNIVNSLGAGKPYLIAPTKDVNGFSIQDVILTNKPNNITFTVGKTTITMEAILSVEANAKTDGRYWLAADKYLYNSENDLPALRALFNVSTKSGMPPRARVALGENAATGLDNITNGENTTIKVIENGQLIIIRNGEKFNAQGQKL